MLNHLRVANYALIEELEIGFKPGFTVITGETGAGKSILIGALGLVLGNRADTNVLLNAEKKCVVEAVFDVKQMQLSDFFNENDLDESDECILRREISPGGKSRAFVNDTPVNLNVLKELGAYLVDIHSQHDSLLLSDPSFQLGLLDELADHDEDLLHYKSVFRNFQEIQKELARLEKLASEHAADQDYIRFQFDELVKAQLVDGEWEELNRRLDILNHSVELHEGLVQSHELLVNGEFNVTGLLKETTAVLHKLVKYMPEMDQLVGRLESSLIELKDVATELKLRENKVNFDENELNTTQNRLDLIHQLMHKHRLQHGNELLVMQKELEAKLDFFNHYTDAVSVLQKQLSQAQAEVKKRSQQLTETRKSAALPLEKEVTEMLVQLGMPHAQFKVHFEVLVKPELSGVDRIKFYFSANKGVKADELNRVASGGELSRLMLSIKSLLSGRKYTPTLIFDEIDTGVSGEIAARVANILSSMASKVQLVSITHLPQIAAKARQHLWVFKLEQTERTLSSIVDLNEEQHLEEIAKMMSDGTVTSVSRAAAKALIFGENPY